MTIGLKLFPLVPRVPIPIDHVMLSEDFCGLAARIGPRIGSDHLPVIVEIAASIPRSQPGAVASDVSRLADRRVRRLKPLVAGTY